MKRGYWPWWLKRRNHLACPACRGSFTWLDVDLAAVDHAGGCKYARFGEVVRMPLGRRIDGAAVLIFVEVGS